MRSTTRASVVGATAAADGQPVKCGGMSKMSKSKNNGVDPQEIIDQVRRRHRAPVHDVRGAARADAGVVRRRRGRRAPLPAPRVDFGVKHARRVTAPRAAPASCRRGRRALRRDVHTVLRQVSYDYERMQYNTVVSGAMKMLNALEDFKAAGTTATPRCCARASASCCARSTRPARTSPCAVAANWATRPRSATCSTRPGPQVDEAALVQDEIELVLQVNGKTARRDPRAGRRRQGRHRGRGAGQPRVREVRRRQAGEEGGRRAGPAGECGRLMPSPAPRRAGCCARRRRCCWPAAASSCGAPPTLPFASIALVGFAPRSPLAEELRAQLRAQQRAGGRRRRRRPRSCCRRWTTRARRAWWPPPPPARCVNCSCACGFSFRAAARRRARADPADRAAARAAT